MQHPIQVIDAIYQWGRHVHPFVLRLQTEFTEGHMHIVNTGVLFEQCAITHPKLTNWDPTRSQPVFFMQGNPVKYTRAPKCWTVGFLLEEPLVENLNRQDPDYFQWFTMKHGSIGCLPPARNTVLEMASFHSELSHHSFPFCHHRLKGDFNCAFVSL